MLLNFSVRMRTGVSNMVWPLTLEEEVINMLEEDAKEILKFMASIELVANPTKKVFMDITVNERKQKVGAHEVGMYVLCLR